MSPDEPLVIHWNKDAAPTRKRAAVFQPFKDNALEELEQALGDGTTIFGTAQVIVVDRETNAPVASDSRPIVTVGCGPDHVLHIYVGVHDEATGTSHIVHEVVVHMAPC